MAHLYGYKQEDCQAKAHSSIAQDGSDGSESDDSLAPLNMPIHERYSKQKKKEQDAKKGQPTAT